MAKTSSASSTPPESGLSPALDHIAKHALRYVKPGQTLGLGTGRAARAFIRALAATGMKVRGVPTSQASTELAHSLGIELVELSQVRRIDTDFDGADEVDSRLNMIKGRGGAMVREKIVAVSSRRRIFLVGSEKKVKRLGERGILPVEVVPFAIPYATREIAKMGLRPTIRKEQDGHEFITDNGNLVIHCRTAALKNPARLERDLLAIPGVVGTGLFLGIADIVLVGSEDGEVTTLRRKP